MKNLLLALVALCLPLCAQSTRNFTTTVTATGPTASVFSDSNYHTLVLIANGSPSACTVRLEGSLDNSNWFDVSGSQSCVSGSTMFHVDGKPLSYVRANLLTFTGATSATIVYRGQN